MKKRDDGVDRTPVAAPARRACMTGAARGGKKKCGADATWLVPAPMRTGERPIRWKWLPRCDEHAEAWLNGDVDGRPPARRIQPPGFVPDLGPTPYETGGFHG